ncbi:MAG TPA: hypothetical protein DCP69_11805 [Candidatus Omnitrophica bacterium]|nr:hypothetical protein [Candidatus Omnitrophota bacterium]
MPSSPYDDPLVQALLGEAAGEGEEGMRLVGDTIFNRARTKKKSLEQIIREPKQFSAMQRPDLATFVRRQPPDALEMAMLVAQQVRQPDYLPLYSTQHYVTSELFNRRDRLPKRHWLNQMEPVQTVGRHVTLQPRQR